MLGRLYFMLIYLDIYMSIPCLFPKDIGGASHIPQMVHFAFKRKFSKCTYYGGVVLISYMEARFKLIIISICESNSVFHRIPKRGRL